MEQRYTFLQPTYFKDFKCSGGNCKLNCCNYNWHITVDKDTYLKYRAVKTPKEFAEKLNKYIKRNRRSKGKFDYAKLIQTNNKHSLKFDVLEDGKQEEQFEEVFIKGCIFQDEKGLCEIHSNLGADALSNTCKIFPRIFNNIFGNYERSLFLGCEEVSKLLYAQKDGIAFELVENEAFKAQYYNIDLSKNKSPFLQYFDEARLICLNILNINDISLDDRFILLGAFMFKLDEFVETKNFDAIPIYMESFMENIEQYKPLLQSKVIREDLFLEMIIKTLVFVSGKGGRADTVFDLSNIMAKLKLAHSPNKKYTLVSKDQSTTYTVTSIEQDGKTIYNEKDNEEKEEENPLVTLENGNVISKIYSKYKEDREKFMEDKQFYLTNLFSHLFFSNGYPFDGSSIKDNYVKFAWTYCHYKALLAGYIADRKKLDEELLHRICTVVGRTCLDQPLATNQILKNIKDNNLDNLPFLSVLIKSS